MEDGRSCSVVKVLRATAILSFVSLFIAAILSSANSHWIEWLLGLDPFPAWVNEAAYLGFKDAFKYANLVNHWLIILGFVLTLVAGKKQRNSVIERPTDPTGPTPPNDLVL